jgi:hypothetical protein
VASQSFGEDFQRRPDDFSIHPEPLKQSQVGLWGIAPRLRQRNSESSPLNAKPWAGSRDPRRASVHRVVWQQDGFSALNWWNVICRRLRLLHSTGESDTEDPVATGLAPGMRRASDA